MPKIPRHLTFANVVSLLALFIALGGSSYAAITLKKNSVRSSHIKNGQVKRADLARNAVDSSRVAQGSLLAEDFAPGQLPAGPQGERGPQGPQGSVDTSNYFTKGESDGRFVQQGGKAADADLLDGQDSSAYLPANGTAANADTLDGLDYTEFMPNTQGQIRSFAGLTGADADTPRRGTSNWEVWYSCPNASPTSSANGTLHFRNLSSGTINLFIDNGSSNPAHTTLAAGAQRDEAALAAGEAIEFDAQGFADGRIAHARVLTRNRTTDCQWQFWAIERQGS